MKGSKVLTLSVYYLKIGQLIMLQSRAEALNTETKHPINTRVTFKDSSPNMIVQSSPQLE